MLINRRKNSILMILSNIILVIYFLATFFPLMRVLPIERSYICFFCALAFLFCFSIYCLLEKKKIKNHIIFILAVYFLFITLPYIAGNSVISHRYMGCSMIFLGPVIFYFYNETNNIKDLKIIVYIVAIFAIITGIITYINLLVNPYLSRSLGADEKSKTYLSRGIGGYEFIYFTVPVGLSVLFSFLQEKRKIIKLFCLLLYIGCLLLIVKSNYMTAFATFIICSLITVFAFFATGRSSSKQIILLVVFVVILVALLNIDHILKLIEDFLPSRIGSVFDTDEGVFQSVISEFVRDRWPTILNSIETFFLNPFFGLTLSGEMAWYNEYLSGFGQHSYIFDTLALYGALLGICNIIIVFTPFKLYKKNSVNALTIAILICMILLYFFNNATESIALAIGVMYPLIRESYKSSANLLMKV